MKTIILLIVSNIFMTFAWYGHLKHQDVPIWKAVLVSWSIAFFEYCLMVPANRLGALSGFSAYQLKMIQEVVTLSVFVVFARFYLGENLKWNHLIGFCFLFAAVYFIFKK